MPLFIPVSATKSAIRLRMRISRKQGFFSQIEHFSFDLAIEYLVDCYYPSGLRAFELSARAVQFFKTYTGKIFENLGEF